MSSIAMSIYATSMWTVKNQGPVCYLCENFPDMTFFGNSFFDLSLLKKQRAYYFYVNKDTCKYKAVPLLFQKDATLQTEHTVVCDQSVPQNLG